MWNEKFEERPETCPENFKALCSGFKVFHRHFFTVLHPQFQTQFQTLFSGTSMTGRPGDRTMEMIGGITASYLARTPCVPVILRISNRSGSKGAFRLPGVTLNHFRCTVEALARSKFGVDFSKKRICRPGPCAHPAKTSVRPSKSLDCELAFPVTDPLPSSAKHPEQSLQGEPISSRFWPFLTKTGRKLWNYRQCHYFRLPIPYSSRSQNYWMATLGSRTKVQCERALHYDYDNDNCQRENENYETTGGQGDNYDRNCHYNGPSLCACDYHHYHPEEEERPAMTTVTGVVKTQGEGSHNDTTTRKTATVTTMQDRLQERLDKIRTSSNYIIRQTDKLRSKLLAFFSQKRSKPNKNDQKSTPKSTLKSGVWPERWGGLWLDGKVLLLGKQTFWHRHLARTVMKKLRSDKLQADSSFPMFQESAKGLRQKICRTKAPRVFVPNSAPNFAPNFPPEIFEDFLSFVSWETETTKNSPKIPVIFQCKIPRQTRKTKKNIHKMFQESRQSNKGRHLKGGHVKMGCRTQTHTQHVNSHCSF